MSKMKSTLAATFLSLILTVLAGVIGTPGLLRHHRHRRLHRETLAPQALP